MIEQLSLGYTDALAPRKVARPSMKPLTVAQAMRDARRRTWQHPATERVEGATRAIPLGKRFWPVSDAERASVRQLVQSDEVQHLVTQLSHRDDSAEVRMLDVAYWMKGCSSLGRLRYAVLLDIGRKAARGRDFCLLDIKEAITAVAPHDPKQGLMPDNNAERVVHGAKAMSPFLGSRMHAGRVLRRSVFVRELLPQDLKLEFERLDVEEATTAAYYLARVVGASHARQMDAATRKAWRKDLLSTHSKVLLQESIRPAT